jgi:hypothetical protein
MIKYYNLDFSLFEFLDDKNVLLPDPKNNTIAMLYSVSDYFFHMNDRNPSLFDYQLFKYYIESSYKKIILKRTYKTLPRILSEISGLANKLHFFIILFNGF